VLRVAQGNDHPDLFANELTASTIFWIDGEMPQTPLSCAAKVRYRQADQACRLESSALGYRIHFDSPQRAITPGQSVVLYQGAKCLGGGVIEAAV
jgi:tRNA-specific 2-thiouridylase